VAHTVPEAPPPSRLPIVDWVACPECDLVQREPAYLRRHTVVCVRCSATLYRSAPHALEMTLALMLAGAVLFAMSNVFPLMSLELQGRTVTETLPGMIAALHDAGMTSVALLVFVTLILMPSLEMGAYLYMLGALRLGVLPPGLGPVARVLRGARPWSMVEVFMLGALVSIGKLEDFADLHLEAGFWCIGAVMLVFSIADTIFDQRDLWDAASRISR
jgi:paraquat-inducible protein A